MSTNKNQIELNQSEIKNTWSFITFFSISYVSLKVFFQSETFSRKNILVLSVCLALLIKAIFEYDTNWKINLSKKKEISKNKSSIDISKSEPNSERLTKTTLVQVALFTPLTIIYLFSRTFWLYLRIFLYTFIDISIFYLHSFLNIFFEIKWRKHFDDLILFSTTLLKNITAKVLSYITPFFTAYFPKIEALAKTCFTYSYKKVQDCLFWLQLTFWKNMAEPFFLEIKLFVRFVFSELQPVILKLAKTIWECAYFFFYELGLEIKSFLSVAVNFLVEFIKTLNWQSLFTFLPKVQGSLMDHINKLVYLLQKLDYQPLLLLAVKKVKQDLTMDVVENILFTSEVIFPVFILWGTEIFYCLYSELPNLFLNVLVWVIEDLIIPGANIAVKTHQRAWDFSRRLYRQVRMFSLKAVEYIEMTSPIILKLFWFYSIIKSQLVHIVLLLQQIYNTTMRFTFPVYMKLSSFDFTICHKISHFVIFNYDAVINNARLQWIPQVIHQINTILESSLFSSGLPDSSSFFDSISASLKPSGIFLLQETKKSLESLTRILEDWAISQGKNTSSTKKSEDLKQC